jgi:hypothetical protein
VGDIYPLVTFDHHSNNTAVAVHFDFKTVCNKHCTNGDNGLFVYPFGDLGHLCIQNGRITGLDRSGD